MPTPPKTPQEIPFDAYLFRALHAAITDAGGVPQIVIPDPSVVIGPLPAATRARNPLILNLSYEATRELHFGNESLSFRTRINGQDTPLEVPYSGIVSVFDRETHQGRSLVPLPGLRPSTALQPSQEAPVSPEAQTPPAPDTAPPAGLPTTEVSNNVLTFPKRR